MDHPPIVAGAEAEGHVEEFLCNPDRRLPRPGLPEPSLPELSLSGPELPDPGCPPRYPSTLHGRLTPSCLIYNQTKQEKQTGQEKQAGQER
jgi:hypothetical protein